MSYDCDLVYLVQFFPECMKVLIGTDMYTYKRSVRCRCERGRHHVRKDTDQELLGELLSMIGPNAKVEILR